MVTTKLFRALLLCGLLLQAGLAAVHAQEPGETEEPVIVVAPAGRLDLTLGQLGYETEMVDKNKPDRIYRVSLPGNFQILPGDNYLDLVTSHFPPTPDKAAQILVQFNSQLVETLSLTAANAASNTLRVDLPEAVLDPGLNNRLSINLNHSGSCEDPGGPISVTIDANSMLSFAYQQTAYPVDLGLYPMPFTEVSLLKIPVTMVLPDEPTASDLSAAATIAAGLGQASQGTIDISTVTAGQLTSDIRANHHLIVIGKPGANSLLDELDLPLAVAAPTVEPGQGVLEEIVSPWNDFRLVLAATGLDDAGLVKAADALNRQAKFLGMRGPVAVVLDLLPLSSPPEAQTARMTLASLGYVDEIAYGSAPANHSFEFTLPLGWQPQEPPFLALNFAHATIIDPAESTLVVKLNGVPVGSALLDESNAADGELAISLPPRLLQAGRNRLDVEVEMKIPGTDVCGSLNDDRAWTVISGDSRLFMPYTNTDLPIDLSLLPYPFSSGSGFYQTVFVLPDRPTSPVLNQLIKLAALFGSASRSGYISPQVVYASALDEDARQERHFILLGLPSQNNLLRQVNAELPQPFLEDSDTLKPLAVDSVAFLPDPDRLAGLLQIIPSPWDKDYTLLAVTGTTAAGVDLAVQAMRDNLSRLKGNLAVVEPSLDPLSGQMTDVKTYSIDTRPPVLSQEQSSGSNNPISEDEAAAFSARWWK